MKVKVKKKVLALGVGILGVLVGFGAAMLAGVLNPWAVRSESSSSLAVSSIQFQDDVVLLSLGIQGITEASESRRVWGIELPGSERTLFLQYKFSAKLGVDGSQVRVTQVDEKKYQVVVPEFVFLGHSDAEFKTAVEKSGALSWATPEIDVPELITQVLSDAAKQRYVDESRELLELQCRTFYTGIVHAVDPEIELVFEFASKV